MIDLIMDWLGDAGFPDTVLRFAVLPILVSIFTIPFSAFMSAFAQLIGVSLGGRRK